MLLEEVVMHMFAKNKLFDVYAIRKDFPGLAQDVYGKPLVYLDNAATAQKPQMVIDAMTAYYSTHCANVHRGAHKLSEIATEEYEATRALVRDFIGAKKLEEIIFVRGATEAINLVANSFGRANVCAGDEILISAMEHHSNIVPWQLLCEEKGAKLNVVPINDQGEFSFDDFKKLISEKTKLVAVCHVSNSLGTINPIKDIVDYAHSKGVPVLVDGAQAAPHFELNMGELDCDFYVFTGHKMFAPTGIGILYGKEKWLEQMPPYHGGGDMVAQVTFEKTTYAPLPHKFEAGTPNISGVIGLGAAIRYMTGIGMKNIAAHEQDLLEYATEKIYDVPGLRLIGEAKQKASSLSFVFDDIHAHDVSTVLDRQGIAVRAGHLCAQPVMNRFNIPSLVRASFAFYNTKNEADKLVMALRKVSEVF